MKVILYFDGSHDLTNGLRAIEEVSKKVGKISVTLTAREKSVFNFNGQNIFVDTLNKFAPNDFDCLICSDKSSTINFPPEKIFTPMQFIKKFSNNPPPVIILYLCQRKVSCLRRALSAFCTHVESRSCRRNYSFELR